MWRSWAADPGSAHIPKEPQDQGGAQLTRRCLCMGHSKQHILCPLRVLNYYYQTGRQRTGRCFSNSYDALTKVCRSDPKDYSSMAFRRGAAMEPACPLGQALLPGVVEVSAEAHAAPELRDGPATERLEG